jgi:hypothetical protein
MPDRRSDPPEPPASAEPRLEPADFRPERDLPGAVLMIPNGHWGFEVVSADDHPGACAFYLPERKNGILVSGTDADNARRANYLFVDPSEENGLHKLTAFKLVPRYFRLHRLKLYFPERHIGRLDGMTLRTLRDELARLNPEE